MNKGYGPEVLLKTLQHDQQRRQIESLTKELDTSTEAECPKMKELHTAAARFFEIEQALAGSGVVKVSQKQRKTLEKEKGSLRQEYGDSLEVVHKKMSKRNQLEDEIRSIEGALKGQWTKAFDWLWDTGFVAEGTADQANIKLTPRGKACAAFADGHPLIIGTIITDGWLEGLTLGEVCAWLCLFLKESRVKDVEKADPPPEKYSPALSAAVDATYGLAYHLEAELDHNLSLVMLDWCMHKDIKRIAVWIEPSMLGTFVKAVMRVISYLDVVREVLLGLGKYEVHNNLDNHTDLLLGGLVTNESLYLRLADDKEE